MKTRMPRMEILRRFDPDWDWTDYSWMDLTSYALNDDEPLNLESLLDKIIHSHSYQCDYQGAAKGASH